MFKAVNERIVLGARWFDARKWSAPMGNQFTPSEVLREGAPARRLEQDVTRPMVIVTSRLVSTSLVGWAT